MHPERRRWAILLGFIGLGVAVSALLHYSSAPPKKRGLRDQGRPVRVLELKPLTIVPRATGYGVVTAQQNWQAVAQVGGAIVEMDESVEVGRVVAQGTPLFRIDPGNYRLEQSRTQATVEAVRAQIGELTVRENSARGSLEVEKKALDLARREFERAVALYENELASLAQVETAERGLVNAEKAVRLIENTLLELPAARKVLQAQLAQQQAGVEGARIDLSRTQIVAPFTMRIREVRVSLHQAVGSGEVLLIGDGIDVMEVPAQLPIGSIGPLLGPRRRPDDPGGRAASDGSAPAEGAAAEEGTVAEASEGKAPAEAAPAGSDPPADAGSPTALVPAVVPGSPPSLARGAGRTSTLTALVRLRNQGLESTWTGKFRRFQGLDPATRTLGVVVEVDRPSRRERGSGPPLSPGLHVEVELRGAERADCLAIPRTALHGDRIWVANEKNRLELREVATELLQAQFVCLAEGVRPGERVVLTDLSPAVEGMLLAPRIDETAASWLADIARGETTKP